MIWMKIDHDSDGYPHFLLLGKKYVTYAIELVEVRCRTISFPAFLPIFIDASSHLNNAAEKKMGEELFHKKRYRELSAKQ